MATVRDSPDSDRDTGSIVRGLSHEKDAGVSPISELDSQLLEIESLTLDERVVAYGQIYDELRRRLDMGDEPAVNVRNQD